MNIFFIFCSPKNTRNPQIRRYTDGWCIPWSEVGKGGVQIVTQVIDGFMKREWNECYGQTKCRWGRISISQSGD